MSKQGQSDPSKRGDKILFWQEKLKLFHESGLGANEFCTQHVYFGPIRTLIPESVFGWDRNTQYALPCRWHMPQWLSRVSSTHKRNMLLKLRKRGLPTQFSRNRLLALRVEYD
jgi:hypothetical protein